jgi:hypothetical protein
LKALVITVDKRHCQLAVDPADNLVECFEHDLESEASGAQIGADGDRWCICRRALNQRRH